MEMCVVGQRGRRVEWLLDCQARFLTWSGSRLPQLAAHHMRVGELLRDVPMGADRGALDSLDQCIRYLKVRLFLHHYLQLIYNVPSRTSSLLLTVHLQRVSRIEIPPRGRARRAPLRPVPEASRAQHQITRPETSHSFSPPFLRQVQRLPLRPTA